jgi:hypothetical protein
MTVDRGSIRTARRAMAQPAATRYRLARVETIV